MRGGREEGKVQPSGSCGLESNNYTNAKRAEVMSCFFSFFFRICSQGETAQ